MMLHLNKSMRQMPNVLSRKITEFRTQEFDLQKFSEFLEIFNGLKNFI